ncbi:MAG: LemA family protein [Saprospiraceae bacterium]|nr:LemA family protein [Saprospiraceae bacterium]MCZ2337120.1 LemA family protein [Chitinophagales bacterium]
MWILLIIVVVVGFIVMSMYNKLVSLKNRVLEAWSGIDVQLKRRYDLIPNLVNTVKGYAAHESGTLEKVIQARNQAMTAGNSGDIGAQIQAENALAGTLKSLFALAENYPDLKANTSFLQLQNTLGEIEENLSNARRYYNALVRDNNTAVEAFPTNLIANQFNFGKFNFFEIENDAERDNPVVQF